MHNASIKEKVPVTYQAHEYTFEVNDRDSLVRDMNFSEFPFNISKSSPGQVDADNNSTIYAQSLADQAESANLTINRVKGYAALTFLERQIRTKCEHVKSEPKIMVKQGGTVILYMRLQGMPVFAHLRIRSFK